MKADYRNYIIDSLVVGFCALGLFLFFFLILPYHLFHREQIQLFLFTPELILNYFSHPAALSKLSGDFLTQFFYYEAAGPVILTILLLLWALVVFRLLLPYAGRWAWLPAILAMLWEAGKQSGLTYPLSGTITLIGIGTLILICRAYFKRSRKWGIAVSTFTIATGYWLLGYGVWTARWYNIPNLQRESLIALDSEMYFGRWQKVQDLLDKEKAQSPFVTYYYNLLNAQQNQLPEKLMDYYQPTSQGLFLPVASTSNYHTIYAANELWFSLGDMTMAEHAAMLGMIFSPNNKGTRAIKRLAEINLINHDDAAAMKYLRLLKKTYCHRNWAEQRIPGKQTTEVRQWLDGKRQLLPKTDTLRSAANVPLSLRHLLRNNPENKMARDYLFCFDLLNKDIASFFEDYKEFADNSIPSRLYTEGLLIYLAVSGASAEEAKQWHIPPYLLEEFNAYSRLYEANQGNGVPLQAKYGKTYWFYFHYAQMK